MFRIKNTSRLFWVLPCR